MADDLGRLIKRRRSELGLTQAQLAEQVGRTGTTVRRWERGEAMPGTDVLEDLATALRVSPQLLDAAATAPRPHDEAPADQPPVAAKQPSAPPKQPSASPTTPQARPATPVTPAPPPKAQPQERPPIFPPRSVTPTERHRLVVPPEPDPDEQPTVAAPAPVAAAVPSVEAQVAPMPVKTPRTAAIEAEAVAPPSPRRSILPWRRRDAAPSYLDDQRQRWRYWLRYALTAIVLLIGFLVLIWALGELVEALGDVWSLFGESDAPDPTSLGTDF